METKQRDITPPESYLSPNLRYTCGHPLKFIQLPTSIDAYKHSFFLLAIKLWNNLLSDIIESQSLEEFQTPLNNYILHSWTINVNVNLCIILYIEVSTVNNHNYNNCTSFCCCDSQSKQIKDATGLFSHWINHRVELSFLFFSKWGLMLVWIFWIGKGTFCQCSGYAESVTLVNC